MTATQQQADAIKPDSLVELVSQNRRVPAGPPQMKHTSVSGIHGNSQYTSDVPSTSESGIRDGRDGCHGWLSVSLPTLLVPNAHNSNSGIAGTFYNYVLVQYLEGNTNRSDITWSSGGWQAAKRKSAGL